MVELKLGLLLVAAYLYGSVPMAYLVAKWSRGIDLRKYGSGQVGGSNVWRSVSKPLGVAVGLHDLFKGALIVWIAQLLGLTLIMQIAVGVAVIVGHNWPVFLNFNAGRGLATTAGVGLFLSCWNGQEFLPWALIVFFCLALGTLVVGSSPLPLLLAVASLPVTSWVLRYFGHPQPLSLTLGLVLLLILMITRRLTAPKSAESTLINKREFYTNRLLFDRDIRDGQTWIHRKPDGSPIEPNPKDRKTS
jgi:acyl phosphate:glycerol-3-phosphate acyltransferase